MADNHTETFWKLVKSIRTCMLTAQNDGKLQSRPMTAYAMPEENRIYFITRLDTGKTHALEDGQNVNLGFAHVGDNNYISVEGTARVVRDPARQQELWNLFAEAYMPEGPTADTTGMIEVTPETATYWSGASWTITQLWQVAVANVLQEEPETEQVIVTL